MCLKIVRNVSWFYLFLFFTLLRGEENQFNSLRVNHSRLKQRIETLAEFGKLPNGGVHRVAFSDQDKEARSCVIGWMKEAGLKVRIDAASNIIGRIEGNDSRLPAILLGSHIDTVPHGGKYDGALGVIAALECIQTLQDHGIHLKHPLEVIVFTDEEGGTIGSRAMIGKMTPAALQVISHSGKTVAEGMRFLGGNPSLIREADRSSEDLLCFIELHIEQGALLEAEGIDIGIVQGIVGIRWWEVIAEGTANHAGTTPMNRRRDALLAAAHFIIGVNETVTSIPGRQVGTVGRITAEPGAPNVIPGKVIMSLEIRDLSEEKIDAVFQEIETMAHGIEASSGVQIAFHPIDAKSVPSPMNENMQSILSEVAGSLSYSHKRMPSGAGHDAQNMAKICPTGMLFVPSVGGVSHSPKEFTHPKEMVKGANVMLQSVLKIERTSLEK